MASYQSFINVMRFIGTLVLLLVATGCAKLAHKNVSAVSVAENQPESEWPIYALAEANAFALNCSQQLGLAHQLFTRLEHVEFKRDLKFLTALNDLDLVFDRVSGIASLYNNVHPQKDMRDSGELCVQKVMKIYSDVSLSQPIYLRLKAIKLPTLSAINRRYVEQSLRVYELAGINQNAAVRAKLGALNQEILKIGQEFSKNTRMDTRELLLEPKSLKGLPKDFIEAHPPNENGLIKLTTDYPDYLPFMKYAEDDAARKQLYVLFRQRGYPQNKFVLKSLLNKRYEFARLVGFPTFAHYATSDKMIESPEKAWSFINQVNEVAKPRAEQDLTALLARLKKIDPTATQVQDWQKDYLHNLVQTEHYNVDPQAVREYFSYSKVRAGIFQLVEDMFEVTITPWNTPVWHPSVESYELREGGKLIGQFYLDMHPREGKYGHAAAFNVQEGVAGIQTPIKALVCNFPAAANGSSLLEHTQVETFLHEFGHLIHGLFSGNQPWVSLAGLTAERDFIEAPSQMLEEWVWDRDTLKKFASNVKGEVISDDMINKMTVARDFGRGEWTRHQLNYAALSLAYYDADPDDIDLDLLMEKIQNQYSPYPFVENTHMYASYGHLYGYSALYYTYMWSSVIAADMFSEFQKNGLLNKVVAERYRKTVLSAGSSKPAAQLVKAFLGREFNISAFAETLKADPTPRTAH